MPKKQAPLPAAPAAAPSPKTGKGNPAQASLPDVQAVLQFLTTEGFQTSKSALYRAKEKGALKARKDGTFDRRAALSFAKSKLKLVESGVTAPTEQVQGTLTELNIARTKNLEVERERKALALGKERGELVPLADFERELAMRGRAFRLGFEHWAPKAAAGIAALFGGEDKIALEIIALVGGDSAKMQALVAWMQARAPELVSLWHGMLEEFFEPYAASSTWWTEEMRLAWDLAEKARRDAACQS